MLFSIPGNKWVELRELAGLKPGASFKITLTKKEIMKICRAVEPRDDLATSVVRGKEYVVNSDTGKVWFWARGTVDIELVANAVVETSTTRPLSELNGQPYISSRWRRLPKPDEYIGFARVIDFGNPDSMWFSNGLRWAPVGGRAVLFNHPHTSVGITGSGAAGTSDQGNGKTAEGNSVIRLGPAFEYLANMISYNDTLIFTGVFTVTGANTKDIGLAVGYQYRSNQLLAPLVVNAPGTYKVVVTITQRSKYKVQNINEELFSASGYSLTTVAGTLDITIDKHLYWYGSLRGNAADEIQLVSNTIELIKGTV